MLQIRSILDVADNTGAKRAAAIGVLGRNQRYARIGDVIKIHIKEAAPDGSVKKGEVVDAVVVRTRKTILSVTHDPNEAACLGDRVVVFTGRPGKIKAEIKVDLPRPRDITDPALAPLVNQIMAELEEGAKP